VATVFDLFLSVHFMS